MGGCSQDLQKRPGTGGAEALECRDSGHPGYTVVAKVPHLLQPHAWCMFPSAAAARAVGLHACSDRLPSVCVAMCHAFICRVCVPLLYISAVLLTFLLGDQCCCCGMFCFCMRLLWRATGDGVVACRGCWHLCCQLGQGSVSLQFCAAHSMLPRGCCGICCMCTQATAVPCHQATGVAGCIHFSKCTDLSLFAWLLHRQDKCCSCPRSTAFSMFYRQPHGMYGSPRKPLIAVPVLAAALTLLGLCVVDFRLSCGWAASTGAYLIASRGPAPSPGWRAEGVKQSPV